jgi:hypothetical protein
MFCRKFCTAILVGFVILLTAKFAEAQDVPGCRIGSVCEKKCKDVVPWNYPTMAACKADWGPRNVALSQAIRDARTKAGKH